MKIFLVPNYLKKKKKERKKEVTLYFDITLDILLTISNFSTTCQLTVLVGCSRLSIDC